MAGLEFAERGGEVEEAIEVDDRSDDAFADTLLHVDLIELQFMGLSEGKELRVIILVGGEFPKVAKQRAEGSNSLVFFSGCSMYRLLLKTVGLAEINLCGQFLRSRD